MEPLLSRALVGTEIIRTSNTVRTINSKCPVNYRTRGLQRKESRRAFTVTPTQKLREQKNPTGTQGAPDSSYSQPAANLSQNVTREEKNHFDRVEAESKEKQIRSPWMREGSERPPVTQLRSAGAMTKGKLLTTPSRMLKLILPLTTRDANKDRKDVEPLALLVHPQQPLSYLERLIQSELPAIKVDDGKSEKVPKIVFRAQDMTEEDIGSGKAAAEEVRAENYDLEDVEETVVDGKVERTGKIKPPPSDSSKPPTPSSEAAKEREASLPAHGHSATSSSQPTPPSPPDPSHPDFVRWSPSTEIGDFIRDAARGKEFAVDIEGAPEPIYVGVPSFNDRTYYLRMRLRKTAKRILQQADIKKECDLLAQRGAKRVAQGGFAGLVGWWGLVYYLTFKTDLGWDVMEPVTYLVGLTGLMGGYMWFLYHNRDVSYRSAMNFTVSRRQSQLYEQKGFNLPQWEMLVEEGNRLRREIKMVADEYDVEWDETKDAGDERVTEALREERKKHDHGKDKKDDKDDDNDDD